MGQYYCPLLIDCTTKQKKTARCWDFGSGFKLMEHSWLRNHFIARVAKELVYNAHFVVWMGDYAEYEDTENLSYRWLADTEKGFDECYDAAQRDEGNKHYKIIGDSTKDIIKLTPDGTECDFDLKEFVLVNDTKKLYLDIDKYAKENTDKGWCPNPISLLTALGNGKGGGDYGSDIGIDDIGSWAFNRLWLCGRDIFFKQTLAGLEKFDFKEAVIHFDPHA